MDCVHLAIAIRSRDPGLRSFWLALTSWDGTQLLSAGHILLAGIHTCSVLIRAS